MSESTCTYCGELVDACQQHPNFQQAAHIECGIRMAVGSIAHIECRCSCYVAGSQESDPPGLTLREAARAAARAYLEHQRRKGILPSERL